MRDGIAVRNARQRSQMKLLLTGFRAFMGTSMIFGNSSGKIVDFFARRSAIPKDLSERFRAVHDRVIPEILDVRLGDKEEPESSAEQFAELLA